MLDDMNKPVTQGPIIPAFAPQLAPIFNPKEDEDAKALAAAFSEGAHHRFLGVDEDLTGVLSKNGEACNASGIFSAWIVKFKGFFQNWLNKL